ncbi:MAG TPA: TlpA disulfide reductase family protein [Bryobacteraceae bacterium]
MRARLFVAMFLGIVSAAAGESLAGRWDATVNVNGVEIPFRFELSVDGANATGIFFNGDEPMPSSSGRISNGSLLLNWDHFAAKLEATVRDGLLDGQYIRQGSTERSIYPFHAKPFSPAQPGHDTAPSIGGVWQIPTKSPKGELAWRLIVEQSGARVSASILRVDGDTGALTGMYRDGKFVLSHFSGLRPALFEITLQKDGSLDILQNGKNKLTAIRWDRARAQGLPEPTDPTKHTTVKDPGESFRYSFPDLDGHLVTNNDARFRGKVVLVNITGSWCPNCHDETPFLVELYRKYRSQGLEIVALSFEEADQLKNPTRLRAFIKKYGIEYTVLLGGEPSEAKDKLTQAVNWNAWPTTFVLGRDGLVRSVHAGFPSSATGDLHRQAKAEFAGEVEKLLKENLRTAR